MQDSRRALQFWIVSDSGQNLPFSRGRIASAVHLSHAEGDRERCRKEKKGQLAKYWIERMKITDCQVLQY